MAGKPGVAECSIKSLKTFSSYIRQNWRRCDFYLCPINQFCIFCASKFTFGITNCLIRVAWFFLAFRIRLKANSLTKWAIIRQHVEKEVFWMKEVWVSLNDMVYDFLQIVLLFWMCAEPRFCKINESLYKTTMVNTLLERIRLDSSGLSMTFHY